MHDDYAPNRVDTLTLIRRRLALRELFRNREFFYNGYGATFGVRPQILWRDIYDLVGRIKGLAPHRFFNEGNSTGFFDTNSKMIAPTWSLPAGPVQYGGTCIISAAYFMYPSLTEEGGADEPKIKPASVREHRRIIQAYGAPPTTEQAIEDWVCNDCYALKGQFSLIHKIVKEVAIREWLRRCSHRHSDMRDFRDHMVKAVLATRQMRLKRVSRGHGVEANPDYFRIHDAGDFYSPEYFYAWCDIAERLPSIRFWAATRAWAVPQYKSLFENTPLPRNLTLRPSELFKSEPSRMFGNVASAMVMREGEPPPRGVFHCPVTKYKDNKLSCQTAGRYAIECGRRTKFSMEPGCRVCWDCPSTPVGYGEH